MSCMMEHMDAYYLRRILRRYGDDVVLCLNLSSNIM